MFVWYVPSILCHPSDSGALDSVLYYCMFGRQYVRAVSGARMASPGVMVKTVRARAAYNSGLHVWGLCLTWFVGFCCGSDGQGAGLTLAGGLPEIACGRRGGSLGYTTARSATGIEAVVHRISVSGKGGGVRGCPLGFVQMRVCDYGRLGRARRSWPRQGIRYCTPEAPRLIDLDHSSRNTTTSGR